MTGKHTLINNSTFYAENRKYCIKERIKHTDKPKKYLVQLAPRFEYISSLFPLTASSYLIEYEQVAYHLELTKDTVVIDLSD